MCIQKYFVTKKFSLSKTERNGNFEKGFAIISFELSVSKNGHTKPKSVYVEIEILNIFLKQNEDSSI